MQIADAQGDVDAFIAQYDAPTRQVPTIAADIARRLCAADRAEEAIQVIDAADRREEEAFIVVSMYARWLKPHPSTKSNWSVGYSDASAHRIISDLSAFIGHHNPARYCQVEADGRF